MIRFILQTNVFFFLVVLCAVLTTAGSVGAQGPSAPPVSGSGAASSSIPDKSVPERDEAWYVVYVQGCRAGYQMTSTDPLPASDPAAKGEEGLVRTRNGSSLKLSRFGVSLTMETMSEAVETPAGEIRSFRYELRTPPAGNMTTVGTVTGKRCKLEMTVAGRTNVTEVDWDPTQRSPQFVDRSLRLDPLKPGEERKFSMYFPEFRQSGEMFVAGDRNVDVTMLDGSSKNLLRVRSVISLLPDVRITLFTDSTGRVLVTRVPIFNTDLLAYESTAEAAKKPLVGDGPEIGESTMIPIKMDPATRTAKSITYRLKLPDEDLARLIHAGPNQTVQVVNRSEVLVTVKQGIWPATGTAGSADKEYTAPSQLLQSDDPEVAKLAESVGKDSTNAPYVALLLSRLTHQTVTSKTFSTAMASAAEVARLREGDCTEHAALLAAMLRTRKIPSRYVVGLVYVESSKSFGLHAWTEAKVGDDWLPLDSVVSSGLTGVWHIRLVDDPLADNGPDSTLRFDSYARLLPGRLQMEVVSFEQGTSIPAKPATTPADKTGTTLPPPIPVP